MEAFDISDNSLTFITAEGIPLSADSSHPNFAVIKDKLVAGGVTEDEIIDLIDSRRAIEGKTFGLVTVGIDAVWYKSFEVRGYLIDKLLRMLGEGIDIEPWARLLDNLMTNPDQRVHERLPLFLEQAQMPITQDGHFLAWRLVKDDYWDIYTGQTFCSTPGAVIGMDRYQVDADPDRTCSNGVHVAAFGYLEHYGFNSSGRRCMLVKVNPANVVSIPTDYSNQKMRVCEALVLREVPKEKVPALFGREDHVASEDGWVEDADYPIDDWKYEVANGDTRLGYDEWVDHRRELSDEASDENDVERWREAVNLGDTTESFDDWRQFN